MRKGRSSSFPWRSYLRATAVLACAVAFLTTPAPAEPDVTPVDRSSLRGTGSLEGRVILGPGLNSRKARFSLYPEITPAVPPMSPNPAPEALNVVIFLEAPGLAEAAASPSPKSPVMEQRGLSFVPHVLPVLRGTPVEFPNADPIFHNVFSLSRSASFDLGRYPRGNSRVVRFDEPGLVKVFCHIHSDMSAIVLVLDNPFFVVPDSDGRYKLPGIPPGEYRVTAWHERARPIRRRVSIERGRTTSMDFAIPLRDAPEDE